MLLGVFIIGLMVGIVVVAAPPYVYHRTLFQNYGFTGGYVSFVVYRKGAMFDHSIYDPNGTLIRQGTEACIANCVVKTTTQYFLGIFPYLAEMRGTTHNLLTTLGKNAVKTNFGTASNQTLATVIELANASFTAGVNSVYCCGGTNISYTGSGAPTAGGTGLGAGQGSYTGYTSTGGGTWTIVQTNTLSLAASATVYGAGLSTYCCGASVGAGRGSNYQTKPNPTLTLIAEALYSSNAVLATADSVQTTWSLSAS